MTTGSLYPHDRRDQQLSFQRILGKAIDWGNKFLEVEFERETNKSHGLLMIPLILIVMFTSSVITLIPKYDYDELHLVEVFLQDFVEFLILSILISFAHHFNYIMLMGKTEVCGAKQLFFRFLSTLLVLFTARSTTRMIEIYNPLSPTRNFHQLFAVICHTVTQYTVLWFQHPKSQRIDPNFQWRYKWYIFGKVFSALITQVYIQTARLFNWINGPYQIALAFWLLVIRYALLKVANKIMEKARGDNEASARFSVACGIGCNHAFYMMIIIGSKAGWEFTIVYFIIDTLLIFRLFSKTLSAVKDQANQAESNFIGPLQSLTTKETLEIFIPICFCPIYIMAYFGPNSEMICPVKDKSINDISWTLTKIGGFMIFDGIRIGLSAFILNSRYKISLLKSYCKMMNNYWKLITAIIAYLVYFVSCIFCNLT